MLFAVLALRLGPDPALPAFLVLGAAGVALALIDVDVRRLPDAITLPLYPVLVVLLGLAAVLGADSGRPGRALLGGAVMFAVYFALCLAHPGGMGFGDVKLSGLLGLATAWLGWGALAVGLFAGFLLGGVWGIALRAQRPRRPQERGAVRPLHARGRAARGPGRRGAGPGVPLADGGLTAERRTAPDGATGPAPALKGSRNRSEGRRDTGRPTGRRRHRRDPPWQDDPS